MTTTGRREKILFVDDDPRAFAEVERSLEDEFLVDVASSADAALELCRDSGPYAVIVSDHRLPGVSGQEFLNRVRSAWPDSVRVLVTEHAMFDLAAKAVEQGDVFRILAKPFDMEELRPAIEDGIKRHLVLASDRRLTERLTFTREALLEFTRTLEHRVRVMLERLHSLDRLADSLSAADSLEEIAVLASETLSNALGGRGVELEFIAAANNGHPVRAKAGPLLGSDAHEVEVHTADGGVGMLRVETVQPDGAEGEGLSEEHRRVAATVAAATGVAAHNQIRRHQRDEAQLTTVFALARLAEQRDNETGLHLERVAEYCRLAAEGLREDGQFADVITNRFIEDLVRSSPLHDIGKVGIPDSILLKPGKLTDEEWVVMKRHTTIGADTLRSILEHTDQPPGFLLVGLEIAWCHHERWDGTGYPRGLAGDEIPLSARILSLADVYDALTTQRPYKQPWPHQKAVDYLCEMGGTQFDARVVEAFTSRADQANRIRERLADEVPTT